MSRKSKAPTILFLFEDEIRAASAALERLYKLVETPKEKLEPGAIENAMNEAFNLAYTALNGAGESGITLILAKKDIFKGPRKQVEPGTPATPLEE